MRKVYSVIVFMTTLVIAKENADWFPGQAPLPHIGNFALPISQQAGPLFSFGQNIIDKSDLLILAIGNREKGTEERTAELIGFFLYGITDRLSFLIEIPDMVKLRSEESTSHGIGDVVAQLEGVVYVSETESAVNEISLVGNMTFPTGSARHDPPTGFGAPSFFAGFTASHTAIDWYYFTSIGGIITTSHHHTKFGNYFLYQFGLGRNIAYKSNKWLLNWEIELDGTYKQRNKILGIVNCNSGGNTVFLGPSLWFATQQIIISGGISTPVVQHLFGNQSKSRYFASAFVGCKF